MPQRVLGGVALVAALIVLGGCETVKNRYQVNVNWKMNQDDVKSIGVLEFDWKEPELKLQDGMSTACITDAGAVVSDMVASELSKLSRYAVRERSDIKRVLEEHAFQLSDVVAKGDYKLIGRLAAVDAVIIGRVATANSIHAYLGTMVDSSFSCRCVSTSTGEVLWSMGGDKNVSWSTVATPPYWLRSLTEELVKKLKEELARPPHKQNSQ